MTNKTITDLEELNLEDLEEIDYLVMWDESEQKTKKISLQTIIEFVQMIEGK